MKVTPEEIANYRSQLADDSKALADLDVIERCEGDLEQAARIALLGVWQKSYRL